MVSRTYKESGGIVVVESKDDMKARTRKSPDNADATFLAIFLCRIRHGLSSNETAAPRQVSRQNPSNALFPPWNPNKRVEQQARPAMMDMYGGWATGYT